MQPRLPQGEARPARRRLLRKRCLFKRLSPQAQCCVLDVCLFCVHAGHTLVTRSEENARAIRNEGAQRINFLVKERLQGVLAMEREQSPLEKQVADALRRARKLPVGPNRNDLRQLAMSLCWLHRNGMDALIARRSARSD